MNNQLIPRPVGVKLTDTSQTTLFTAQGDNLREIVDWINVCNTTGSSATITISWTDASASTTYALVSGTTVPANGAVRFNIGFRLAKSDTIKATAGTGNALEIVLKVSETGGSPVHDSPSIASRL